jgi:hypothetical protein
MANALGIRSFYHMLRRRLREPTGFEVRYWSPSELRATYTSILGSTRLEADCFLGLGLQWSDINYMNSTGKAVVAASEALRHLSQIVAPVRMFADSLFCTSVMSIA